MCACTEPLRQRRITMKTLTVAHPFLPQAGGFEWWVGGTDSRTESWQSVVLCLENSMLVNNSRMPTLPFRICLWFNDKSEEIASKFKLRSRHLVIGEWCKEFPCLQVGYEKRIGMYKQRLRDGREWTADTFLLTPGVSHWILPVAPRPTTLEDPVMLRNESGSGVPPAQLTIQLSYAF